MLRHRLVFGSIMIAVLLATLYLDELISRVDLTGTALAATFAGAPNLPGGLVILIVVLMMTAGGARELTAILRIKGIEADTFIAIVAGTGGCTLAWVLTLRPQVGLAIGGADVWALPAAASFAGLLLLAALVKHSWPTHRTDGAAGAGAAAMLALIYMGVLPGFYLMIRQSHSAWVVAGVILIVKTCDSGAYFTGRSIGRHKLIPWLSPGKTWEGLAGGLIAAAAAGAAMAALGNHLHMTAMPLWYGAVAGVVLGVVGHAGDLVASLLKRDAGLKDSGNLIPGMGGLLDVVDSPLAAAPVAYWLLVAAPAIR